MLVEIHKEDENGNVFTLKEPDGLRIEWNGKTVLVPYCFESDGASVPRMFWLLVFPSSDTTALRAAFAHDYIYRNHPDGWTKEDADNMFYDLLVEDGVPKWRAWIPVCLKRSGGIQRFRQWLLRSLTHTTKSNRNRQFAANSGCFL